MKPGAAIVSADAAARVIADGATVAISGNGAGMIAAVLVTGLWLWHQARVDAASATLVEVVPRAEQALADRDFPAAQRLFAEAVAAVDVLGATLDHQGQAGDEGDQARPDEGIDVAGAVVDHQGQHGNGHAHREGDQEDAVEEADDAKGRQGHGVRFRQRAKRAILTAPGAL